MTASDTRRTPRCMKFTTPRVLAQDSREGIDRLRRLSESLSKREPRNTSLHLKVSKPFARVCGRDPVVLQLTIGMLESVRVSAREGTVGRCRAGVGRMRAPGRPPCDYAQETSI